MAQLPLRDPEIKAITCWEHDYGPKWENQKVKRSALRNRGRTRGMKVKGVEDDGGEIMSNSVYDSKKRKLNGQGWT